MQVELEVLVTRFLQQPLRFRTRFLDIGPEAGKGFQFFLGRRQFMSREHNAARCFYNGDFRQVLRTAPAING